MIFTLFTLLMNSEDGSEENQDTVEQILKCIIENEGTILCEFSGLGDRLLMAVTSELGPSMDYQTCASHIP